MFAIQRYCHQKATNALIHLVWITRWFIWPPGVTVNSALHFPPFYKSMIPSSCLVKEIRSDSNSLLSKFTFLLFSGVKAARNTQSLLWNVKHTLQRGNFLILIQKAQNCFILYKEKSSGWIGSSQTFFISIKYRRSVGWGMVGSVDSELILRQEVMTSALRWTGRLSCVPSHFLSRWMYGEVGERKVEHGEVGHGATEEEAMQKQWEKSRLCPLVCSLLLGMHLSKSTYFYSW